MPMVFAALSVRIGPGTRKSEAISFSAAVLSTRNARKAQRLPHSSVQKLVPLQGRPPSKSVPPSPCTFSGDVFIARTELLDSLLLRCWVFSVGCKRLTVVAGSQYLSCGSLSVDCLRFQLHNMPRAGTPSHQNGPFESV